MPRKLARAVAVTALVLCSVAAVSAVVLRLAAPPESSPDSLVVIGDGSADRVAEVRAQEEALISDGARYGQDPAGSTVGLVLLLLACLAWMGVGVLIISRQPRNWAGWIFLVVGSVMPLTMLVQVLVVIGDAP